MVVTPWEVRGEIDYTRLIKEFGVEPLTEELLQRMKKMVGELHFMLRRKIFFSHRDFDKVLEDREKGEKIYLYTGRGPSGHTHIGHIVPWIFTRYLQKVFNATLYFQITDDEKFLVKRNLSVKQALYYTYENSLDLIALGFKPENTRIISDIKAIHLLYELAISVAKRVTFSTAKAVFGFEDESNIGIIFFPAIQAAPAFLGSKIEGRNLRCLIPCAIDQDPYWRVTRDVAPKLGYYKPAGIFSKFIPGLGVKGKMSASEPETCIFTVDKPEEAEKKIMNAFTGGQPTIEEQRRLGGKPEVCPIYLYYYFIFEEDDEKVFERERQCKNGELLCGECKRELAEKVSKFLVEHQKKREKAKDLVDKYMLTDLELG